MISRAQFEQFLGGLPGVTFVEQWGSLVAKVGGKVFALRGFGDGEPGAVAFKVPETSFEILTSVEGITQAPYFAKRHWVHVAPGAMPQGDVEVYLLASHRIVATGLTKKLQRDLGLLEDSGRL